MIIGDPSTFAIESHITVAYERLGFRGLGYFVIHIGGLAYGVREPDATLLACSLDEIDKRLASEGRHIAPFSKEPDSDSIADAFRSAIYGECQDESFFGLPVDEFQQYFSRDTVDLMWAPDGDQAFDDGSYILQFDIENKVRLISFKCNEDGKRIRETMRDIWLTQSRYYGVLKDWRNAFYKSWQSMAKVCQ